MMAAVARQGFDLCGARDRPTRGRRHDRAAARAAAAGIPVRQRRDAPRRRSDPAAAGQRPDGADHRRERHRQGADRARHPRRLAAQRGDVPALQLHDDHARAGRQPVVRPSPRLVHRRGVRSAGPDSHRRRRHAVPRRSRRPAARRAAEAAALPRAGRDHAGRREPAAARRRPRARRHQRRPRAARRRGQVPRGSLLTA